VFTGAVHDQLIPSSPATRVTLPRAAKPRLVPLTVEQVAALADTMPDRCRAMIYTQAGTGLRVAELLALRVCDVDFLRRVVHVTAQLDRTGQRVALKTPESERDVPLPAVVADALAAHLSSYPADPDALLFTGSRGQPRPYPSWRDMFARAVSRAGLPAGTTTHDLRHHYASVLLEAGESVVAVASRLGHANATLVLSTYGHLMPDTEDRTRRAIDAAWSTPSAAAVTPSG
jgi:integrase